MPHRVVLDDAVCGVCDADEVEQLGGARAQFAATHSLHPSLEHQVLAPGSKLVDARVLGDVTDQASNCILLAPYVVAEDRRCATVGEGQCHEHANGR